MAEKNQVPFGLMFTTLPLPETESGRTDGVAECIIYTTDKPPILKIPGFPQLIPRPVLVRNTPPYRIEKLPGKGLGVLANRDLRFGELIASERPLLVVSQAMVMPWVDNVKWDNEEQRRQGHKNALEEMIASAVKRMKDAEQRAYKGLGNCFSQDSSWGPLSGIMNTNSYNISIYEGLERTYAGIFNHLSRFNHSCSPNTIHVWNRPSFSMQVYAVRDIRKHEELTVDYCPLVSPYLQRKEVLSGYQMRCKCPACLDPFKSDKIRSGISQIPDALHAFLPAVINWAGGATTRTSTRTRTRDMAILEEMLNTINQIETEGLQSDEVYPQVLYYVVHIYCVLGDDENVKKYGKKWLCFEMMRYRAKQSLLQFSADAQKIAKAAASVHRRAK